ncbi:cystathionine beta-lyase domain protein [Ancylostoma caninum]|uniref:Cystathionine beta-lyase domain protein n=1 Tax=Ancylostoma caninum TaxID=29170 RepID=A0A368GD16_ANCCA|nr:cystathionine beta-lyase domain protein [Ancylostoma caninum]
MKHWERLKLQQFTTGSALSPFDAALVARGLKTLPLRVDKICSNALAVAQFLAKHPKVHRVSYPGLESHPTHEAAKKYMKNWSGMIGFDVGTAANAIKVAETVRLIVHAVSLGGTESLMEHPLSMSHGSELLREETEPMVPPGLLRLRQRWSGKRRGSYRRSGEGAVTYLTVVKAVQCSGCSSHRSKALKTTCLVVVSNKAGTEQNDI